MQNINDLKAAVIKRLGRLDILITQYEEVVLQPLMERDAETPPPDRDTAAFSNRWEEFQALMRQFIESADFVRRVETLQKKETGLEEEADQLYHMLKSLPPEKVNALRSMLTEPSGPAN